MRQNPSQKQRKYFNANISRYEYKYKQDLHFLVKKAAFCFQITTALEQDSCSVLETASSVLSKERIGKSSVFFSCQHLWSGISETANVSRVRMLEQKHAEEAWSAERGYFLPSETQTFQCRAVEIKHSRAVLCQAGASWSLSSSSVSVPSCTGNTGSPTSIWVKIQALQGTYLAFYVFWKSCI